MEAYFLAGKRTACGNTGSKIPLAKCSEKQPKAIVKQLEEIR